MFKKSLSSIACVFFMFLACGLKAEEVRDYYSEPGLNPFKQLVGHTAIEQIDPFSGIVQLQQTDLVLPGNGGMDISIHRSYTTPQVPFGYDWFNEMGLGWTMHYGRIVHAERYLNEACVYGGPDAGITSNNPSIEMPDGGREMLFYDTRTNDFTYITKSNWKVSCLSDGTGGFLATSPNGTKYWMNERSVVFNHETQQQEHSWYTTKIEDVHGNTLNFTYTSFGIYTSVRYLSQITSSDGRVVDFTYMDKSTLMPADENTKFAVISTVSSGSQVWQYQYTQMVEAVYGSETFYFLALTSVIPPEGDSWHYTYSAPVFPYNNEEANVLLLDTVTYPYGGVVDYDYQFVDFYLEPIYQFELYKWVIASKTISGPNVTPGTWNYDFAPGSGEGIKLDVTTITEPDGSKTDYYHYGHQWANSENIWAIGLLAQKITYAADGTFLEKEFNDWGWREISKENYTHTKYGGDWKLDQETKAAYLKSRWVTHGDINYGYKTEYKLHDIFGNPQEIVEVTNFHVEGETDYDRVKQITYRNDETQWIIGLPETEKIVGLTGQITRQYNAQGKLISEDNYGIKTDYTYYATGDLHTIKDANNNVTTFSDYKRGAPQRTDYPSNIDYPEAVFTTQVINDNGTLASETNGRGFTKSYTWDGIGRLNSIDFPINDSVSITWGVNTSILVRGNYNEIKTYDGFGNVISVERTDLSSNESIVTNTRYDSSGRIVFQSYPMHPGDTELGVHTEHDGLGRVVKEVYADGTEKATHYVNDSDVIVTDAQGKDVKYTYRFYGTPDTDRALVKIWYTRGYEMFTRIERDKLNNMVALFQGSWIMDDVNYNPPQKVIAGIYRYYTYNDKNLLETESHPESELVTFGYDEAGNLKTKHYASLGIITYNYDALNRLRLVEFPNQSDYVMNYNANNRLENVSTSTSSRAYGYDDNDNLISEIINIDGTTYTIGYDYNTSDFVSGVTYPSGKTVDFMPDAFGRATKAGSYASNIQMKSHGQIASFNYGNGLTLSQSFTDRIWVDTVQVPGIVDYDYDYYAQGNIKTIDDNIHPENNRSMIYDTLDRVTNVTGSWGTAIYSYDAQDNIEESRLASLPGRNNWNNYNNQRLVEVSQDYGAVLSHLTYSDKGEVQSITKGVPGGNTLKNRVFDYDDQGNMISAILTDYDEIGNPLPAKQYDFLYDTQNNRIQKIVEGKTTQYVFGNNGQLLGEYVIGANLNAKEHIYLQGKKIASLSMIAGPVVRISRSDDVFENQESTLVASIVDDDAIITSRLWEQISGPIAQLGVTDSDTLLFTAPAVVESAQLTFKLTVTDANGDSASDTVTIEVKNTENPVIELSEYESSYYQDSNGSPLNITLDASQSYDPEGLSFSFNWVQVSGPSIDFLPSNNNDVVNMDLLAGSYVFTLLVENEAGLSKEQNIEITVKNYHTDEDADNLPDGWEMEYFGHLNVGGSSDPDGDYISTYQEYLDNTDPSQFTILNITSSVSDAYVASGDTVSIISWSAKSSEKYNIYWSSDSLVDKATANVIYDAKPPFVHNNLTNGAQYHYIVEAKDNGIWVADSPSITARPNRKTLIENSWLHYGSIYGEYGQLWVHEEPYNNIVTHEKGYTAIGDGHLRMDPYGKAKVQLTESGTGNGNRVAADERGNILTVSAINGSLWWQYYDSRTNSWTALSKLAGTYDVNEVWGSARASVTPCGNNRYMAVWVQTNKIYYVDPIEESLHTAFFHIDENQQPVWSSINRVDPVEPTGYPYLLPKSGCNLRGDSFVTWIADFDYGSNGSSVRPYSVGLEKIYVSDGVHPTILGQHLIETDLNLFVDGLQFYISNDDDPEIDIVYGNRSVDTGDFQLLTATANYSDITPAGWGDFVELHSEQGITGAIPYTRIVGNLDGDRYIHVTNDAQTKVDFYYKDTNSHSYNYERSFESNHLFSMRGGIYLENTGEMYFSAYVSTARKSKGKYVYEGNDYFYSVHPVDGVSSEISDFQLKNLSLTGDAVNTWFSFSDNFTVTEPPATVVDAPVVSSPVSTVTVETLTYLLTGTHGQEGTTINVYTDVDNNNDADNANIVASATVVGGVWSASVPLTENSTNDFVVQATDGTTVSMFVDVPTITHTHPVEIVDDPLVNTPASDVTIDAMAYAVSGSHSADGTIVNIYQDSDNNNIADDSNIIASDTVSGGSWTLSVPLAENADNNFVIQATDGLTVSNFVDVPTISELSSIELVAPVVSVPHDVLSTPIDKQWIRGFYDSVGITINIYADADNDGIADNTTVLASSTVKEPTVLPWYDWEAMVFFLPEYTPVNLVAQATDGVNTSAFVDIPTIIYDPSLPAATVPVTTMNAVGFRSKGKDYYDINLTADQPASSYFKVSGAEIVSGGVVQTEYQHYTGTFRIQMLKGQSATVYYFSYGDVSGSESAKVEVLQ